MKLLDRYRRRWREFWKSLPARAYGTHVAHKADDFTRLRATAPTVPAEETAKLVARGYRASRQPPVDFENLPA